MKTVTIGLLGAGRAAELHLDAYARVAGVAVRLKTICDAVPEKAETARDHYGFENATADLADIFADADIDAVDICTPPCTHKDFILAALAAGKHVICEKPLCGFFGPGRTDKAAMQRAVEQDLSELGAAVAASGKIFCYAENFLYAPAVEKAAEILRARGSKILYAKGEESLAGSSSPVAGLWEKSGGGTLMRVGCHPLAAILWLKQQNDPAVRVTRVVADLSRLTDQLTDYEHRHIKAAPLDVEDHATVCLTFSDGTKAVIMACDSRLGGSKNLLELYCNDAVLTCNLTQHDTMSVYLPDADGMEGVGLSEMLTEKRGWNHPDVADETLRGYVGEMQDFLTAIAENRQPRAGFALAEATLRVIYEAYRQSEAGR